MNEARKISGSLALGGPARVITIPATQEPQNRRLRVAAYARVSSSSEDQKHSFAAQTAHYTELITSNPEWDFVDMYADEGITGTSAEKREDFQRLLADCRRGRIDKVLVKSSSRFARNAKECLEAVRELKALGVGVCFEEQNIDTSQMSGELLTAMFSMPVSTGEVWGCPNSADTEFLYKDSEYFYVTSEAEYAPSLRGLTLGDNYADIIARIPSGFGLKVGTDQIVNPQILHPSQDEFSLPLYGDDSWPFYSTLTYMFGEPAFVTVCAIDRITYFLDDALDITAVGYNLSYTDAVNVWRQNNTCHQT